MIYSKSSVKTIFSQDLIIRFSLNNNKKKLHCTNANKTFSINFVEFLVPISFLLHLNIDNLSLKSFLFLLIKFQVLKGD